MTRRQDKEAGLSMVEVMIAMVVATVATGGILMALLGGFHLHRKTTNSARAGRAIMQVHATLRSGDLDTRVAEFKTDPARKIRGITVRVSFPQALLTDMLGGAVPTGWRYRDTNSDGQVDLDAAATSSASLVPVTLVASWGSGQTTSSFFLTEK